MLLGSSWLCRQLFPPGSKQPSLLVAHARDHFCHCEVFVSFLLGLLTWSLSKDASPTRKQTVEPSDGLGFTLHEDPRTSFLWGAVGVRASH